MRLKKKATALLTLMSCGFVTLFDQPAPAQDWLVGDVFAGVSNGRYFVYSNAGVFKEQITQPLGGFTTGAAFNPTLDKLYTTNFTYTKV
ncbi:MAG: hypothetical protein ACE5F1_10010 [Planctomycetota bacterium]